MTRYPWSARMGTRAALAALAALLAGCGQVEVRSEPLNVPTPIAAPCAEALPEVPAWAVDALKPEANDFQVAQAYRAEREQHRQYERELRASRAGCDSKP